MWNHSVTYGDRWLVLCTWRRPEKLKLEGAIVGQHRYVLWRIETLDHVLVSFLDVDEEAVDQYRRRAMGERPCQLDDKRQVGSSTRGPMKITT